MPHLVVEQVAEWSGIHRLTVEEICEHAPTLGGVYILYNALNNGNTVPVSVGQGDNLRAALLRDLSDGCPDHAIRGTAQQFAYCEVGRESRTDFMRFLLEAGLYALHRLEPSGNAAPSIPLPIGWDPAPPLLQPVVSVLP